jgi:hypothetical protein
VSCCDQSRVDTDDEDQAGGEITQIAQLYSEDESLQKRVIHIFLVCLLVYLLFLFYFRT